MKLALGTVQFGLPYGVSNPDGKVAPEKVEEILSLAKKAGIDTLDCAAAYGESEQVIGALPLSQSFKLITKIPKLAPSTQSILPFIESSFKKLKRDSCDGLLFHHADDLMTHPNAKKFIQELQAVKKQGIVNDIGASLYSIEQWQTLNQHETFSLFQVPVNVFDQRFITSSVIKNCQEKKLQFHCRSLFLQGLLLMQEKKWPDYFSPYVAQLTTFHQLATELNCSLLTLALSILVQKSLNNQRSDVISRIVVGCCSTQQLMEILTAYEQAQNLPVSQAELSHLACENTALINPSLWQLNNEKNA